MTEEGAGGALERVARDLYNAWGVELSTSRPRWAELPDETREGWRRRARYLLERYTIEPVCRAEHEEAEEAEGLEAGLVRWQAGVEDLLGTIVDQTANGYPWEDTTLAEARRRVRDLRPARAIAHRQSDGRSPLLPRSEHAGDR